MSFQNESRSRGRGETSSVAFWHHGVGGIVLLCLSSAAAAQPCIGDCDTSESVSVHELVLGVGVALGNRDLGDCSASDGGGASGVTVDELVEAVRNALEACPSIRTLTPSTSTPTRTPTPTRTSTPTPTRTPTPTTPGNASEAVEASSRVAISSLYVFDFGSLGPGGSGGGQSMAGMSRTEPGTEFGGGAGTSCFTLSCFNFDGLETRCCDFPDVQFFWSNCLVADGSVLNGSYRVESNSAVLCNFSLPPDPSPPLAPPAGVDFRATLTEYSAVAGDFLGNVVALFADFAETFTPSAAPCGLIADNQFFFDPLNFGIRGNGFRSFQGSVRRIAGNQSGPTDHVGVTAGTEFQPLSFDVFIQDDTPTSCRVLAELNGELSISNLITGEQYTETYAGFSVLERSESPSTFLVDLAGATVTDCLGTVGVSTRESLRLSSANACPIAGELELTIVDQQVTSRISYTDQGGIRFDFNADGFIDDARESCADLGLSQCNVQPVQGVCGGCIDDGDCLSDLVCSPCFVCESVEVTRCAPEDVPAFCEDGIF
jgi:hypothetical protein